MNKFLPEKARRAVLMNLAALLAATALIGCSGEKNASKAPEQKQAATAEVIKPGDPAAGKEIYLTHCHFCHGRTGHGDGPVGIAISPHPADFVGDRKRMAKTDAELFKSISKGIHKEIGGEEMAMPRWQDILTEQERWDVLAYIRQLEREGLAAIKNKGN